VPTGVEGKPGTAIQFQKAELVAVPALLATFQRKNRFLVKNRPLPGVAKDDESPAS
jgi:hypothetical protein